MNTDENKVIKRIEYDHPTVFTDWLFICPGCKCGHSFRVGPEAPGTGCRWQFNGDEVRPTFSPSLLVNPSEPSRRCHSFVREGQILFLDDCHHDLRGQTVDLKPF